MMELGAELRRRGHQVTLGLPVNLVAFAERAGFTVSPLAVNTQEFMEMVEEKRWLAAGNVKAFTDRVLEVGHQHARELDENVFEACDGADVVVSGILTEDRTVVIAEHSRRPLVLLHSAPMRRTPVVANPYVTTRDLAGLPHAWSHTLFERLWWRGIRSDVNEFRRRLGLPSTRVRTSVRAERMGVVEVQAYSATLVPGLEGWGPRRPLVGVLNLDPDVRSSIGEAGLDPDLERWLAAGPPPAYFGFGSMPVTDPAATLRIIEKATRSIGMRAVVSAGWSEMAGQDLGLSDQFRMIGSVDHSALFPRCAVAVHHGGAGTTAATIGAGLPTMVCSVIADQPFWGAQLERLGAGAHLRFCKLTEERLEVGLRRLLEPAVRSRAAALGEALRREPNGVPFVADIVERSAELSKAGQAA
jgi:UDP:flavonoid glycosyltransferase YjiC (YdhE family)